MKLSKTSKPQPGINVEVGWGGFDANGNPMSGGNQWTSQTITTVKPIERPVGRRLAEDRLEALEKNLSVCVVCGAEQVFVLCDFCKEAVRQARSSMFTEVLEKLRPVEP